MKTDNTMTAEQHWKEWARGRVTPDNPVVTWSVVFGIKAYKCSSDWGRGFDEGLKKAIEKLDTVLPNNPE